MTTETITAERAIQLIRELSPRNDDESFRAAVLEIIDSVPKLEAYEQMLAAYVASMGGCGKSDDEIVKICREELDADIAAGIVHVAG